MGAGAIGVPLFICVKKTRSMRSAHLPAAAFKLGFGQERSLWQGQDVTSQPETRAPEMPPTLLHPRGRAGAVAVTATDMRTHSSIFHCIISY